MADTGAFEMYMLFARLRRRRRAKATLQDLRKAIAVEKLRWEWARSIRIRHYVTLDCMKPPEQSPWMATWRFGSDKNFLNLTSLTRASFCRLLERFSNFYHIPRYRPKGGRPPRLRHHHQVLGALLCFYVNSAQGGLLCLQFGAPPATMSRVIMSAEAVLCTALKDFAPARIVWPSLARQAALAKLVSLRQPLLNFTWGFLDGKNYKVIVLNQE
eukprot:jgi/Phyca11/124112/e_gw1.52.337.1